MSNVDHPQHYNAGSIEVIDAIEDWGLGFSLGNAVKYVARAEHKADAVEDLEKAIWYLRREVARRRGLTRIVVVSDHGDRTQEPRCCCSCAEGCPLGKSGSQARCTESELHAAGVRTRRGGSYQLPPTP